MAILGISLGTRRNGIAVIQGNELEVAQVHSHRERWSKHKIAAIIAVYDRYIKQYNIRQVVIKTPKASHFTLAIKQLIRSIDKYVKRQGCLVEYTTIENIKKREGIKNRTQLRELVVAKYPDLVHEKQKDMKNKWHYYTRLFEATIIAHQRNSGEHE